MPGIFDTIIANGILSHLFGNKAQAAAPSVPALDTGDDTQRMLNRQRALEQGGGSVTNPNAALPAGSTPARQDIPMILQAMANNGVPTGLGDAMPSAPAPAEIVDRSVISANVPNPPIQSEGMNFGKFAQAMNIVGRGLMTAGSRDPAATAAEFAKLEHEIGKPKVVPLANGAFSMVIAPDGSTKIVKNADVASYLSDQGDMKKAFELLKINARADADVNASARKEAGKEQIKSAGDTAQTGLAVNELESIANDLEKTDTATGPAIGLIPKWGRDIVTPAGADLQDRAERIIQASLRQTLGSQFTEKEGARFLERAYNPRLDEKTNAQRLRQVAKELADIQANKDAALDYMKKNGSLDGFKAPQSSMPGREQSAGQDLSSQAQSAFGSYDPNVYEYRINNGVLQRRKK